MGNRGRVQRHRGKPRLDFCGCQPGRLRRSNGAVGLAFDTLDELGNQFEGWYVDDVSVEVAGSVEDFYAVTASAGDTLTAVVNGQTGLIHVALVEISGAILSTGASGATNFGEKTPIGTAPTTSTYYLRVTSDSDEPYSLTVLRNAEFDAEANDSFGSPQQSPACLACWDRWMKSGTGRLVFTQSDIGRGGVSGNQNARRRAWPFQKRPGSHLELYSPSGQLIGGGVGDRNELLIHTVSGDGGYRVRIANEAGTTGEYFLSIRTGIDPEFHVTHVGDSGAGSLHSAIESLNAAGPGTHVIRFEIPGPGPHAIALASELPALSYPTVLVNDFDNTVVIGGVPPYSLSQTAGLTKSGAGAISIGGEQHHAPGRLERPGRPDAVQQCRIRRGRSWQRGRCRTDGFRRRRIPGHLG